LARRRDLGVNSTTMGVDGESPEIIKAYFAHCGWDI
jgi:hypothetical protein